MARIIVKDAFDYIFDIRDLALHELNAMELVAATRKLVILQDEGEALHFRGAFTLDKHGDPVGGELRSITGFVDGEEVLVMDGMAIDVRAFLAATETESGADDILLFRKAFAGADYLGGGSRRDLFEGFDGNDVLEGFGGDDRLVGGAGNDRLVGGWGNDVLKGDAGRDTLLGESGRDLLDGGSGNDVLQGGSGGDTLKGGDGDDRLRGDSGADKLTGGSGRDRFEFVAPGDSRGDARDAIADFRRGHDRIDLSAIDADSKAKGNQAFDFIGSKAFSGEEGELRFKSGVLYADVNGDRIADFAVKIVDIGALGDADFIL